jgi:hypothetical protein
MKVTAVVAGPPNETKTPSPRKDLPVGEKRNWLQVVRCSLPVRAACGLPAPRYRHDCRPESFR